MQRCLRRVACHSRTRSHCNCRSLDRPQFSPRRRARLNELISARCFELRSEKLSNGPEASPLRVGRRRQILLVVQELDVEQGDRLDLIGRRELRRSRAIGKRNVYQRQEHPYSECCKQRAAAQAQIFGPATARTIPSLSRDLAGGLDLVSRHTFIPCAHPCSRPLF
jgi:hypothetical protein